MSDQKVLTGRTVVVLATDGFEDSELTSPRDAVSDAGAAVVVATPGGSAITGKNGTEVPADAGTADVDVSTVDAVLLPGGTSNADALRLDAAAVSVVRDVVTAGKPVGVICHGAWILTDADVLRGRTLTSFPSLRTDLVNAGATWVDEEAHTCEGPAGAGTIVSSRTPDDLPAFNAAVVAAFAAS
jgi:protease I